MGLEGRIIPGIRRCEPDEGDVELPAPPEDLLPEGCVHGIPSAGGDKWVCRGGNLQGIGT